MHRMKRNVLLAAIAFVAGGIVTGALLSPALDAGAQAEAAEKGKKKQKGKSKSPYMRKTIDLGVVVSDIDKSLKFYKQALGFREATQFKVSSEMGGDAGLSDYKPFKIHVLVLGEGKTATKLKLMEFKDASPKKAKQDYIHSTYGYSYITTFIKDTTAMMKRLKKHGVKPVAKGPVDLPEGFPEGIHLTVVKDPDGNFIELVGPKK